MAGTRVCLSSGKSESNTQVEDISAFFLLVFSVAVHLLGAGLLGQPRPAYDLAQQL